MSTSEFQGQTALITGGTSGIGKAAVLALAGLGANVVFTGRRAPEGEAVAAAATKAGEGKGKVLFVQGDVTREADVEKAVKAAVAINGRLSYAFNNAGVELAGVATTDATPEQYHKVMDINVLGVLLSMKHEIRAMSASGGGSIVNTSSIAGSIGMPTAGIYIASKHAVLGLTKTAALEVAKSNIRVNAVSPAAIETEMLHRFTGNGNPDMVNWLTSLHPIGRLGKSEEIARPVLFLFSKDASYITGHDLRVDGAFTAQ